MGYRCMLCKNRSQPPVDIQSMKKEMLTIHAKEVYYNLKVSGIPLLEGQTMNFIYAMSVEVSYVNKTLKNETTDF
ncbi:putative mitochondrial protein [Cucumis melo var. makuwa]|uniref:Putative mitochondrial protein n=1 Tax=Cucumis melo var. makuwa TaxID=1194695 RepID=A0A5D3E2I1_CUCMM|nr:putative mitochondrial protein [Cucumis melo var. makuwa]